MSADTFPAPPREVLDAPPTVAPALDVEAWVLDVLLDPDGTLHNPDHVHLGTWEPRLGFLWATESLVKKGRRVLGRCQTGKPTGDAWQQLVRTEQLLRWFGDVPDFVVTLDAHFVSHALRTDRPGDVLALVEHELYHCGIEKDRWGAERFTQHGHPIWGVRAHDVEEFAGVVRRYGVAASAAGPLVEAADHVREHGPEVAQATIEGICGTCRREVAAA